MLEKTQIKTHIYVHMYPDFQNIFYLITNSHANFDCFKSIVKET